MLIHIHIPKEDVYLTLCIPLTHKTTIESQKQLRGSHAERRYIDSHLRESFRHQLLIERAPCFATTQTAITVLKGAQCKSRLIILCKWKKNPNVTFLVTLRKRAQKNQKNQKAPKTPKEKLNGSHHEQTRRTKSQVENALENRNLKRPSSYFLVLQC